MSTLLAALACAALGGGLGGLARVWMIAAVDRRLGTGFPWGTLAVNGSGSAAIGLLAGLAPVLPGGGLMWSLLVLGLLGSFTTVSSFSLQTLVLWQGGARRAAVLNVAGSTVLCLAAAAAGLALGARLVGG